MLIELLPLLVLGFASYRVTRFIVFDTLIQGLRHRFFNFLLGGSKFRFLRNKTLDLFSCTYCAGVWVSLAIYSLYLKTVLWNFTAQQFISLLAVAGVQALIHNFEADDEH